MRSVESIQRRLRLEEFKAEYLRERIDVYFDAANMLITGFRGRRSDDGPGRC
jgi:hypothetical protein